MRRIIGIGVIAVTLVIGPSSVAAQVKPHPALLPSPVTPCCNIVAIDAESGVLTIRDRTTEQTYRLSVPPAAASQFTVGQTVYGGTPADAPHYNAGGVLVAAASGGSGTTKLGKAACDACKIGCIHMAEVLFGSRSDGHGGRIWSDAAVSWYQACTSTRCSCRS